MFFFADNSTGLDGGNRTIMDAEWFASFPSDLNQSMSDGEMLDANITLMTTVTPSTTMTAGWSASHFLTSTYGVQQDDIQKPNSC